MDLKYRPKATVSKARDYSGSRRAYLDSYAKTRNPSANTETVTDKTPAIAANDNSSIKASNSQTQTANTSQTTAGSQISQFNDPRFDGISVDKKAPASAAPVSGGVITSSVPSFGSGGHVDLVARPAAEREMKVSGPKVAYSAMDGFARPARVIKRTLSKHKIADQAPASAETNILTDDSVLTMSDLAEAPVPSSVATVGSGSIAKPNSSGKAHANTTSFTPNHQSLADSSDEISSLLASDQVQKPGINLHDQDLSNINLDYQVPEVSPEIEANLKALYEKPLSEQIRLSKEADSSLSNIKTVLASSMVCGVLAVGIFTGISGYDSPPVVAQPIGSPVIEVESSGATKTIDSRSPNSDAKNNEISPVVTDPSQPVQIIISSIGVNAAMEGLGTTPEGLMAVPESYSTVGWYNKSVVPGQPGPSVLAGHFVGNGRGVFDKLKDLKNGDLVTVVNGRGQSFTYKVTVKKEYDKNSVPMEKIFSKSDKSRLEIITCSGQWQADSFNQRLVVTAELVD